MLHGVTGAAGATGAGEAQSPAKIVVVSTGDPYDASLFSGTARSMVLALSERFSAVTVIRQTRPLWFRLAHKLVRRLSGGRVLLNTSRRFAAWQARGMRAGIAQARPQAVVCIANSALGAELGLHFPVIHVSDTTFDLMRTFYPSFSRLAPVCLRSGEASEAAAIRNSAFTTVSSPWAAASVLGHYGKAAAQVRVLSWGCNMPHVPLAEVAPAPAAGAVCRLVFIGLDWQRKGGDIVLETARRLHEAGFACHFDMIGAMPPEPCALPNVTFHGLLDKSVPEQMRQFRSLLQGGSILFLPTRQDCTPMVFVEANAFGIPALARDVGGVSGVITHGENGLLLAGDATAEDCVAAITGLWQDRPRYLMLRQTARAAYDERLNWQTWSRGMADMIESLPAA